MALLVHCGRVSVVAGRSTLRVVLLLMRCRRVAVVVVLPGIPRPLLRAGRRERRGRVAIQPAEADAEGAGQRGRQQLRVQRQEVTLARQTVVPHQRFVRSVPVMVRQRQPGPCPPSGATRMRGRHHCRHCCTRLRNCVRPLFRYCTERLVLNARVRCEPRAPESAFTATFPSLPSTSSRCQTSEQ